MTSEEKLGSESLLKLMISMGIPSLFAQLINILYNIVDRVYIGHIPGVGADALTGVGVVLPIITIITAFSAFVGYGGAPIAGIALGQGDKKKAETILGNGVVILICFSVFLTIFFMSIKNSLLYAIGASDVTFPYADRYITIYLCGTLFVQLTVGLNSFITAQGESRIAMYSVLIGAVTNIVLDPILIFGFNMGVAGAAIATIFSQGLSALWVLRFLTSKRASLTIKKENLRLKKEIVFALAALGISPFIMQSTESLISVVLNRGLKQYGGDLYVGSLTILQSVVQLIFVPINGFSHGVQPIISYNYGAGNVDRVKKCFKILIAINFVTSAVISALAITNPKVFASMFTNDKALIDLCGEVMPIFLFGMLIFGIQMGCQPTLMAMGQAKLSLLLALLRKVILLVPLAIILPAITNNVMGIYYAEPISDILAATICSLLFLLNYKKILSKAGKKEPETIEGITG